MPPDYSQSPPNPNLPPIPAPGGAQPAEFDFILKPEQTSKPPILAGQTSPLMRVIVVAAGFFILLIVFIIVKSLIFKGPDLSGYVTVAKDQESMITLITTASGANQLSALPVNDQNLAATAQLSLTSNQSQVLAYLKRNGHAVSSKTLVANADSSVGTQLNNAKSAGDYNTVFQSLLTSQLNTYINDINKTYPASGSAGKALLKKLYAQAELMVTQLT